MGSNIIQLTFQINILITNILFKNVMDVNEKFNMTMINMETKPQWLKNAIKRWNSENDQQNGCVANAQ